MYVRKRKINTCGQKQGQKHVRVEKRNLIYLVKNQANDIRGFRFPHLSTEKVIVFQQVKLITSDATVNQLILGKTACMSCYLAPGLSSGYLIIAFLVRGPRQQNKNDVTITNKAKLKCGLDRTLGLDWTPALDWILGVKYVLYSLCKTWSEWDFGLEKKSSPIHESIP